MNDGHFGGRDRPGPYDAYGPQDDVPGRYQEYPQRASRGGFRGLPFPHYSTRTRRGTQVSVGGCCLPIPIGCLALTLAAGGVVASRVVHRAR